MFDPGFAVFARRLLFLAALAGFGYAFAVALDATHLETPPAAFAFGACLAGVAFWQDWALERARKDAAKLKEQAAKANDVIGQIAELCADHLDPRK